VLKLCSSFVGGFAQIGGNLDCLGQPQLGILQGAQVHGEAEVYGRFMGGSDKNTSNSGRFGQSVQFMQIVQCRINTSDFASC